MSHDPTEMCELLVGLPESARPRIAPARQSMSAETGRWSTLQVGKYGRTLSEVDDELSCDWHTINDAMIAYGSVLVDDPDASRGRGAWAGRGAVLPPWTMEAAAVSR